jgi:PIN domain nuclease of toxin-antitoxin system
LKVVLDTHMWLWWLLPESPLRESERRAIDRLAAAKGLALPAICLWEAQMLSAKRRISLPLPFPAWVRRASASDMLTVLPMDVDVVIAVDALPESFHGDPADRLVVATARAHDLPLASHDKAIRRSRLVRMWKP